MDKLQKKLKAVKDILDAEINGEIDLPEKTILFTLSDQELTTLMTKKRLELIRVIGERHPKSIQQLADFVNRKLPAVDRDLKILIRNDIIKTQRGKQGVQPTLNKTMLILPLTEPKKLMEIASG